MLTSASYGWHALSLLRHPGDADVEPHRRVERRLLVDDQVLELVAEGLGLFVVDEVAVLAAPVGDGVGHPVGDLLERRLPVGGARVPRKYFWARMLVAFMLQVEGTSTPELLEGDRAGGVVGDPGVSPLPRRPCRRDGPRDR